MNLKTFDQFYENTKLWRAKLNKGKHYIVRPLRYMIKDRTVIMEKRRHCMIHNSANIHI